MRKKTFFSPFLAIGALVGAVFVVLQILPIPWEKRESLPELTDASFPRVPPQDAGEIYRMLGFLDKLFEENQINYWIDGVTLLGAVRHKGLIPWESESEVQVSEEDLEKILSLQKKFEERNMELKLEPYGFRLVSLHNPSLAVDLLATVKEVSIGKISCKKANFSPWMEKDLFPLSRLAFGPLSLQAPKNHTRHLTELYGKDIMHKAWHPRSALHRSSLPKPQAEVVDFTPAPYESYEMQEVLR